MTTPAPAAASPEVKAPATPAAAAAPAEPKKTGTTNKLFPDMVGTEKPGAPQKPEDLKETSAPATPAPEAAKPAAPAPEPAKAEVLDLDALKGKKIKMVVDGKEELVSAEDALRRLQLDSHLTQKAQRLDAKEQEIVEKEKALKKPQEPAKPADPEEESILSDDPLVKKLLRRLDAQEKELESHRAVIVKQQYTEGVERLANHVKATLGADDFKTYLPKIEDWFRSLPPEQRQAADNDQAFLSKYQELKLKDLISGSHAAVAPVKPAAPVERPASVPMKVEGAEGAARVQLDDWDIRLKAALDKAKLSGSDDDWADVVALKREVSKAA